MAVLFDVYVTSLDEGFRKPHPAMFHRAKDMAPAKALGLRTVLVAIQEPPGDTTHADAVVRSVAELREVLLG